MTDTAPSSAPTITTLGDTWALIVSQKGGSYIRFGPTTNISDLQPSIRSRSGYGNPHSPWNLRQSKSRLSPFQMGSLMRTDFCSFPLSPDSPSSSEIQFRSGISRFLSFFSNRSLHAEGSPPQSSFSSDGCFFAYTTSGEGVHVWKESPTGYLPYQRLQFFDERSRVAPRLSQNAESIIVSLQSKIHRLHTRDQVPSLPSVSTGDGRLTSPWVFPPRRILQHSHGGGETRSQSLTSNPVNRSGTPTWVWR